MKLIKKINYLNLEINTMELEIIERALQSNLAKENKDSLDFTLSQDMLTKIRDCLNLFKEDNPPQSIK